MVDLEKLCIAFGWAYGTEIEREHLKREPNDGHTPESLWAEGSERDREFIRRVVRSALTTAKIEFQ